jgi:TRAP-type mannitol/chloroaromatic compound transport system substrate-binding protein
MNKKVCTVSALVVLVLSLSMWCVAPNVIAAAPINWKFQDTYEAVGLTAKHPTAMFIKMVEAVSQGQIKITRYEPGAFVPPAQALDGLSKGMYDVAYLYPGYYSGTIPLCNVEQGLPFGWTTVESHYTSMKQFGLKELLREEYAKHNIFWLSGGSNNDLYNIGTKKPIRRLSDVKGLKLRAVGVYADYVKLLGATPVNVPSGEIYMAIKLGTIDGLLMAEWFYETHKLGEVMKYYLRPTTNVIGANICVNMDSWKRLPESLRTAIQEAAFASWWEASLSYGSERMNINDKISPEKYGVQYTTLPPEEEKWLIETSQSKIWPLIAAKDQASAKGVDIVRKARKYLGLVTAD